VEKEEVICKIIAGMYNGILVEGRLSCRNGQVQPFRRSYRADLDDIKNIILQNLHEVRKKIKTEENLDILEYVLDKIPDNDGNSRNRYRYSSYDEDERKTLIIPIESHFAKSSGRGLETTYVKDMMVTSSGEISFTDEEGGYYNSVSQKVGSLLIMAHREEINRHCKNKMEELQKNIKEIQAELDEIKERGGNILTMATLIEEAKRNK